jgi:hypothetical protein
LVVYYDSGSLIKAPLECITREFNNNHNNHVYFWIDKLALLGAKREGTVLFWDDALDASLLLLLPSSPADTTTTVETLLERVVAKCSQNIEDTKMKTSLTFRKSSLSNDNDNNNIWTIETIPNTEPSTIITESPTTTVRNIFSLHNFKMHLRICVKSQKSDTIVECPAMYYNNNNNNDSDDIIVERIQLSDILPLNKNTMISGATTNAPNNIGNVLKQEFGENWESELLLNFRRKERRV